MGNPFTSPFGSDSPKKSPRRTLLILLFAGCLAVLACGKKEIAPPAEQASKPEKPQAPTALIPEGTAAKEPDKRTLILPTGFGKRTGDLDEMVKQRTIRALIVVNPICFFYQGGRPQGIQC